MEISRESILALLMTNDRAVERALIVLFDYQTADEKSTHNTRHENGQGFTAYDAPIMSSMATQVLRNYPLTQKQLAWLRGGKKLSRIGKYAGQLARHAIANPKQKSAA